MIRYLIMSIILIVGLALPFFKTSLRIDQFMSSYIDQLSSALLIGGTLSFLFSLFWDKVTKEDIFKHFAIRESILDTGLSQIYMDSKSFNYSEMISSQQELFIVLNDAQHWAGHYSNELTNRFSENKLTEFFIVDPNGSFLQCLAQKTDVSATSLKAKIESVIAFLQELYSASEKKGELNIYALKNYPTHSIYCGNQFVVITPYQVSSGRRVVPLYIYKYTKKKCGVAPDTLEDVSHLRNESKLIWSTKPQKKATLNP